MTQSTIETLDLSSYLVEIRAKDGTMKQYLPAAWRLYALRLMYPQITIESEIIHMDVEHNMVIVKAWIYNGATYAESSHRASSYKQGLLSALDKVETGAKARAARDFGIGTEYALDMEAEDVEGDTSKMLASVKAEVKTLGMVRNPSQWQAWKKQIIGRDLADNKLTAGHVAKLSKAIEQAKQQAA